MKNLICKIGIGFILLFCTVVAEKTFAQANESAPKLSAQEAVQRGLSNNLNIEMQELSVDIADLNTGLGAAGMLPTIDASASANFSLENTNQTFIDGSDVINTGAQSINIAGAVNLEWTIFSGMQLSIQRDILDLDSETARMELKQRTFNLTADILSQYQEIIYYIKYEKILQQNQQYIADLVDLSEKRKELGSATELDVLQAETDLVDIENSFALARMQEHIAKSNLNLLIEQDVQSTYEVDTTFIQVEERTYGEWAEIAFNNNFEILLQEQEIAKSSMLIQQEKGALWPRINLNAGLNYNYLNANSGFLSQNNSYGPTIGISAQYNIYDGGRVQRNIEIAQVEQEVQHTQKERTVNTTENSLYLAYQQFNFYRERIMRDQQNIDLVRRNLNLARKMYKRGRINQYDLRQVRQQLLDMEERLLVAKLNESQFYIELKRISGSTFF